MHHHQSGGDVPKFNIQKTRCVYSSQNQNSHHYATTLFKRYYANLKCTSRVPVELKITSVCGLFDM